MPPRPAATQHALTLWACATSQDVLAPGFVRLGDGGVEFAGHSTDFDHPVQMGVVALVDAFDPFHEFGKRFELGPLVVDHVDRAVHATDAVVVLMSCSFSS